MVAISARPSSPRNRVPSAVIAAQVGMTAAGGFAPRSSRGFTLIEILVVLALVGTLMLLVAPRYLSSVDRSKEVVLKENLYLVRDAIDKYFADTSRYPDSLQDLVGRKYLRRMPIDPITDSSSTWLLVPPSNGYEGALFDVRSGASGAGTDGSPYGTW